MRRSTEALAEDLARQREFLLELVPGYARLLEHLSAELPRLGPDLERVWQHRSFFAWYDRPLLLLASLRFDALTEGPAHPLWLAIGESGTEVTVPSVDALRAALEKSRSRFWDALARRSVQTNETTRAVTWLWPANLMARSDAQTPLHLVDVGTSAGLNLLADDPELRMVWTDEDSNPLELRTVPPIATRLGLDLSPLDVRDPETARWLRACVWPTDTERLKRLDRAISVFQRATMRQTAAPILESCPIEHVAARVARVGEGERLLVLQTIVRDYLSPNQLEDYETALISLIAGRPPGMALWVELEVDYTGGVAEKAVVLRARVADRRGQIQTLLLARTHPHPKKLFVLPGEVQRLVDILRSA